MKLETKQMEIEDGLIHLSQEIEEGNIEYKRSLVNPTPERLEKLTSQLKWRLFEGQGEALYELGVDDDGYPFGLSEQDLLSSIENLKKMANFLNCDVSIVSQRKGRNGDIAEILVRELREHKYCDIRIAVCGQVDSGKSTLVGVLTEGILDNGRGTARVGCFKHQHEITTGRTSSISHHIIGFDQKGECINSMEEYQFSWGQIIDKSYKTISFIDLAGHEKYLRTTVFGMLGHMPDYCFLVIAANVGLKGTSREHLQLAMSMKIPIIVIITKIDICSPRSINSTLQNVQNIFSLYGKNTTIVDNESLIDSVKQSIEEEVVPIFCISNVTGENLDILTKFLYELPLRNEWEMCASDPAEIIIAQSYNVSGVEGVIVGGIVTAGYVRVGDIMKLGPDEKGQFKMVTINSIHSKRVPVREVNTGQFATFALSVGRQEVRKGMVLLDMITPNVAIWTFQAHVQIIQNASPINTNYQPVIQCKNLRQCARITEIQGKKDSLQKGDKAVITFMFLYKPEYIKEGMRILIGEGRNRGVGIVSKVIGNVATTLHASSESIMLGISNEVRRSK